MQIVGASWQYNEILPLRLSIFSSEERATVLLATRSSGLSTGMHDASLWHVISMIVLTLATLFLGGSLSFFCKLSTSLVTVAHEQSLYLFFVVLCFHIFDAATTRRVVFRSRWQLGRRIRMAKRLFGSHCVLLVRRQRSNAHGECLASRLRCDVRGNCARFQVCMPYSRGSCCSSFTGRFVFSKTPLKRILK